MKAIYEVLLICLACSVLQPGFWFMLLDWRETRRNLRHNRAVFIKERYIGSGLEALMPAKTFLVEMVGHSEREADKILKLAATLE